MRWLLISLGAWGAGVFAPLAWLWLTVPIVSPEAARPAEAALIFGALVRDAQISPLHAERLDTGAWLLEAGRAEVIVVSNAARAAAIMEDYLLDRGVSRQRIEIDATALSTPDTCVAEAARAAPRSLLLVSQAYHLPRIALQCRRLGVTGQYVAATRSPGVGRQEGPILTAWVRARRHTREALLVWAELLGAYRELERGLSS